MFYSLNSYSQFKVNQPALGGSTPTPPSFADTKSFQFDGVTDYITPLITSGLDFSGSFTLMAWVKTNAIGSNQFIIDTSTSGSSGNGYSVRINTDGKIKFWSYAVAGLVNSTTVLSASTWYHVACVHDTVGGTNKIYIDGILDNTSSYTFPTASNTTNLRIGRSNLFSGSFDGFINEVGFFGTDLSANINSIFNGGLPDSLTAFNPSSWFRMGEEATWNGSKFVLDNQGSIGGTATSVGILPTDPNPTTDVPLFDNKSFAYDGIADYVDCSSASSSMSADNEGTISVWVQPNDIVNGQRIICFSASTQTRQYLNFTLISSGFLVDMRTSSPPTTGFSVITDVNPFSLGTWVHLAIVQNGVSPQLYVDGVAVAQTFTVPDNDQKWLNDMGSFDSINIGRLVTSDLDQNYFDGLVNDVSYFSSALSSSDILTIFNGGLPNDISALSPLGYWRAEQVTFDGTDWTLIDQGSGGNNGTSVSMPLTARTSDVPLFDNKSFTFDGSLDLVSMGNVLTMASDGTDSFSVSLWFKTTSTQQYQQLIGKQNKGGSYEGWALQVFAGATQSQFRGFLGTVLGNARVTFQTSYSADVRSGNWNHVTMTYDGSQLASGFKVYLNGSSITVTAIINNTPADISNATDFLIGQRGTSSNWDLGFDGSINDASYFNSKLTQEQVTEIYNGDIVNDISSLNPLGYWRAEEVTFDGSNWTMIDQGSGANNGTSQSMPLTSRTSDVPT